MEVEWHTDDGPVIRHVITVTERELWLLIGGLTLPGIGLEEVTDLRERLEARRLCQEMPPSRP